MSAHKRTTITINEEQYRQLHEAAMKKRFLEKDIPAITRELRQETQKAVQRSLDVVEQRQERYQHLLENMQSDVRDSEIRTHRKMEARDAAFWAAVETYAGNLWNETTEMLLQDRSRIFQQMQADHKSFQLQFQGLSDTMDIIRYDTHGIQNDMNAIQNDMHAIRDEKGRREQIALSWLETARDIADYIEENYDHVQLFPGAIEKPEALLQQALGNFENGIPESAISLSQQASYGYSALRIELENRQTERDALYLAVAERNQQLIHLILRNQVCPAVDMEGNELDYTIDVDEWTDGSLSKRLAYLEDLQDQLNNHAEMIEPELLRELLSDTFPEIQNELEESIRTARMMVLNAQIRVNIADLVLQALQDQGYAFEQSGYDQEDMRHSYFASTRSLDGSQVIIQVDPVEGLQEKNELHIHTLDSGQITHHELRQRTKEINHSLAKHGLQMGATKTQPADRSGLLRQFSIPQTQKKLSREQEYSG